eukprot:g2142.t1
MLLPKKRSNTKELPSDDTLSMSSNSIDYGININETRKTILCGGKKRVILLISCIAFILLSVLDLTVFEFTFASRKFKELQHSGPDLHDFVRKRREKPKVLIVVHSAASRSSEAREKQRKVCKPLYSKRGNVDFRFVVGAPSVSTFDPKSHQQGMQAPKEEQAYADSILEESKKYGDIIVLPMRDMYIEISFKVLGWMRWGAVDHKNEYDYLLKTDDEYCIDLEVFDKAVLNFQPKRDKVYLGFYEFNGDENKIMQGPAKNIAPFMSGWIFGFSTSLAEHIVVDDWFRTVLFSTYGTTSDDANVGKWVQFIEREHSEKVHHVVVPMKLDISKLLEEEEKSKTNYIINEKHQKKGGASQSIVKTL